MAAAAGIAGMIPAFLQSAGGVIGGTGQLIGGWAGSQGLEAKDLVLPIFDPSLDLATQAAAFNNMSGLGFGQIGSLPDPIQQLLGRIRAASIDEKTKRRAITGIQGTANRVTRGMSVDDALGKIKNPGRVDQVFRQLGIDNRNVSLPKAFEDRRRFDEQIGQLKALGLDDMNLETIKSRFQAATKASQLIGEAASFGGGGQPTSDIGRQLLELDKRRGDELRDQLGVQANFGGINPAAMTDMLSDYELDRNLRLMEQALGISGALNSALSPFTQGGAATGAATANAAQIAAQQAAAASQLRGQLRADEAGSFAAGLSGALGSLGSGLSNSGLLMRLAGTRDPGLSTPGGSGFTSAGLNFDNVARSFATPGVYGSGR